MNQEEKSAISIGNHLLQEEEVILRFFVPIQVTKNLLIHENLIASFRELERTIYFDHMSISLVFLCKDFATIEVFSVFDASV